MNDSLINNRPTRKPINPLILKLFGGVLLVAAAFLYWREVKENKIQNEAANLIREKAAQPLIAMGLMLDSTGSAQNILIGCPVPIATNILYHLSKAEPTRFPKGIVEGDEYKIYLMYTNRTMAVLRAARLYDEPHALYVGLQVPSKFDENKTPIEWTYSAPAYVPDLGDLFKKMADTHVPTLQKNAALYHSNVSNINARLKAQQITNFMNHAQAEADGTQTTNTSPQTTAPIPVQP